MVDWKELAYGHQHAAEDLTEAQKELYEDMRRFQVALTNPTGQHANGSG
jgi:hypothetical protein